MTTTTITSKTKSQEVASEVNSLIRARNSLLWIVTREEARVELLLFEAILEAQYYPYTWDVDEGVTFKIGDRPDASLAPVEAVLTKIREASLQADEAQKKRGVWILRDLPAWIAGAGQARALRKMRNLARRLSRMPRDTAQAVIVLTPSDKVPPELADHATVIKWPLPDRKEIAQILTRAISVQSNLTKPTTATYEAAVDAAVGLSGEEATACFARTITQRRIDPKMIAGEKKRIVERDGLIEWYDPIPFGLDAVGGLDALKAWLNQRKLAFSEKARARNLPTPKGILLFGVSGCGKSLTAKAVATAWTMPLVRVDLGALKGGIVGSSEQNLRRIFETIAAIGRCVVWFDEVEKALAGSLNGARDAGVSADQLGTILQWMQEHKGDAFVVMTANDIGAILTNAPELLRKGRLDEIWFVDLPNMSERQEVLKTALRANKRDGVKIDLKKVAAATDKFTGAEIAELVPDAMFTAFADDDREITTADLINAARKVIPLSKSASTKISELRKWVDGGNARRATSEEKRTARVQSDAREVDFDPEPETQEAE